MIPYNLPNTEYGKFCRTNDPISSNKCQITKIGGRGCCRLIRFKRHYLHFVLNKPNIKETYKTGKFTEIPTLVKIHTED